MKVLLLASASLLLVAGAASAQQAPGAPPAAAAASVGVTDAEASAVASIGANAKRLQDEAAPGIAAAATPEDKRKAQYALDDKMEALFKANNITFERYNAIATQAQTDKALSAKIASAPMTPMLSASAPASASPASASAPDVPGDPGKGDIATPDKPKTEAPPIDTPSTTARPAGPAAPADRK